jgi:hypothetical protein
MQDLILKTRGLYIICGIYILRKDCSMLKGYTSWINTQQKMRITLNILEIVTINKTHHTFP